MTRQEHLLVILAEECSEIAQRVSKALRFGLYESEEGQNFNNAERLMQEVADFLAVTEMLADDDLITDSMYLIVRERLEAKKKKVEKYLEYSRKQGTLDV